MKSAYELAMERLQKEDPKGGGSLSDAQRRALSEIEKRYQAKIAEREIFLQKQLDDALAAGKSDDAEQIRKQTLDERIRLKEEMEKEKEKIRKGAK